MLYKFRSHSPLKLLAALTTGLWSLWPALAQAAAEPTSVGEVMVNTHNQFGLLIPLISAVSYVGGTAMIVQILNKAVEYSEAPGQKVKATGLVMRTFGASALFQLPSLLGVLRESLLKGTPVFATNWKVDATSGEGLDTALVHMVRDIAPGLGLVIGLVAFISGMFMIVGGIMALSNYQYQQDQVSKKGIAVRLGVGTALTTFAPTVTTLLGTVFNSSTSDAVSTLAYSKAGLDAASAAHVDSVFNAIFVWLSLIGLIAILRGLWVLYGSLEGKGGPGSLMAPLTHLIAGAALVNIVPAIRLVEATLGCGDGSACQILT